MKQSFIIHILTVILFISCRQGQTPSTKQEHLVTDSLVVITGEMLADTIIYDVIIRNIDFSDTWTNECLKYLKRDRMVDLIFDNLYSGNALAYDYFTNELLTLKQLKELEKLKEFDRERIGKVQFREAWYYNPHDNTMAKRVIDITLGYELYDHLGVLSGYKPAFRLALQ